MIEMVINGVSTRKIEIVTEELCGKIEDHAKAKQVM